MYFVRPFFLLLLLAVYLLCVALTFVQPHQIAYSAQFALFEFALIMAIVCLCLRLLARRCEGRGWPMAATASRIPAALCELAALLILILVSMRTMDYLSKGTAMPLADDWLSKIGPMLGFSWPGYFELVRGLPALHQPMIFAYHQLNSAIGIFLMLLALSRQHDKVRIFTEVGIVCGILGLIGGALFPAMGAAAYWVPGYSNPEAWAGYPWMPGVYFVEELKAVRQLDAPMLIGETPLSSLVTFPSIHTALAVAMITVARRTWIFWPALAYGIVMIAATPIWGGHYLADLISGAVMAVGAVLIIERFPSQRRPPGGALAAA
jgi:hypothetical protein